MKNTPKAESTSSFWGAVQPKELFYCHALTDSNPLPQREPACRAGACALSCTTHSNRINFQRWLAYADRHGLAGFAAHADTAVQRQIIAHH